METDWWNDDLERFCKKKKSEFVQWLESKTVKSRGEYVRCRNNLRMKVKKCKRENIKKCGPIVFQRSTDNNKAALDKVNKARKSRKKTKARL